jgi:hypothetical protein
MLKLVGVPGFVAEEVWPEVLPYVQRMLDKTREHRYNAADILQTIIDRDRQLWLVIDDEGKMTCVVITEIINYPQVRECNVFMVSGNMTTLEGWREVVEKVVEWAAESGCHYVSSMARRGSMKAMGWEDRQTYIVRGI